jgi:hypothetical protein
MRKMTGISGPVKNGVASDAMIESIADTGTTISSPSAGPEAPVYQLGLQVTPIGGAGAPYQVTVKAAVPRLYIPMVLPGARLGVMVDPQNPMNVSPDFTRIGGAAPAAPVPPGSFRMDFDASGQPAAGEVAAVATGVRSGTVNTIRGSADQLLATGTHGTAVITTALPLADPSRLDDPMWIFTVEVTLAGQAPFPAVFGHRVPLAKLAAVAPGVTLAVAVNEANKTPEVAIDWDKSPIGA